MQCSDRAATLAATMLRFRRSRRDILPAELFGEPAWDLLLELFVADAEGEKLTARQVCERSGINERVLSRWLLHLDRLGFVVGDGQGEIDDLLTLTATALERLERLFGAVIARRSPKMPKIDDIA